MKFTNRISVFIKELKCTIKSHKRLSLVGMLGLLVIACCFVFHKWNEVPEHHIDYRLTTIGDGIDSSFCNFRININYGKTKDVPEDLYNKLEICHKSSVGNVISNNSEFLHKFKSVSSLYGNQLVKMRNIYVLDYTYRLDIPILFLCTKSNYKYDNESLSYIDAPLLIRGHEENSIVGSGFVAFSTIPSDGTLAFRVNMFNSMPSFFALWDITQGNYHISFANENVRCDTISIEFYGATLFSNMYPSPNKTTMSGVEFTDSTAIQEIIQKGLRFHAEFVELREISATRTFLLSAILSLIISFVASIAYGFIFKINK